MRKLYTLFFGLLIFSAQAQVAELPAPPEDKQTVPPKDTTYWSNALKTGLNVTQASFSDNWKAGGVNNFSFTAFFQGRTDYIRDRHTFRTEADLQYGSVKNRGLEWRKSLDKIWLDTKYGYSFSKAWSFYGSVNFLSQFADGYQYDKNSDNSTITSTWFAPAFLTESFGVEYKPLDYFFVRFGTGTLRQTFVYNDSVTKYSEKNFGVPLGKNVRNEVAFQLMASYDRDIYKNLNLKARYIGFVNYELINDPSQWDHRLEVTLLAKVTKYISTSLAGILVYDKDQDDGLQYSQQIGLGILYTVGDLK